MSAGGRHGPIPAEIQPAARRDQTIQDPAAPAEHGPRSAVRTPARPAVAARDADSPRRGSNPGRASAPVAGPLDQRPIRMAMMPWACASAGRAAACSTGGRSVRGGMVDAGSNPASDVVSERVSRDSNPRTGGSLRLRRARNMRAPWVGERQEVNSLGGRPADHLQTGREVVTADRRRPARAPSRGRATPAARAPAGRRADARPELGCCRSPAGREAPRVAAKMEGVPDRIGDLDHRPMEAVGREAERNVGAMVKPMAMAVPIPMTVPESVALPEPLTVALPEPLTVTDPRPGHPGGASLGGSTGPASRRGCGHRDDDRGRQQQSRRDARPAPSVHRSLHGRVRPSCRWLRADPRRREPRQLS